MHGNISKIYSQQLSRDRRHRVLKSSNKLIAKESQSYSDKIALSRPEPHLPSTQQKIQDKKQRLLLLKRGNGKAEYVSETASLNSFYQRPKSNHFQTRAKLDIESVISDQSFNRKMQRKRDDTHTVISAAKSLLGDPRVSGQGSLAAQVAA